MAKFKCKYKVELLDIGIDGRMSNKAALKILENAAVMHSECYKLGINDMKINGISWVLLGWKVKIIKRPKYNEELIVYTWSRDPGRVSSYRDYEIYDDNNNLCVVATSKWAVVDCNTGKLSEITDKIIEPYKSESTKALEEEYNFKLREPEKSIFSARFKAQRRDIDFNRHVHNLNYLDYAYETIPQEVYDEGEQENIEIMYKRQIKLDDEFICLYQKEDEKNIITIKSIDNSKLHAIIKLY